MIVCESVSPQTQTPEPPLFGDLFGVMLYERQNLREEGGERKVAGNQA